MIPNFLKLRKLVIYVAAAVMMIVVSSRAIAAGTVLSPGDISIITYSHGGMLTTNIIEFVTWVPLNNGTTIKFTDNGWLGVAYSSNANATGAAMVNGRVMVWNNNTGNTIAAGTVIRYTHSGTVSIGALSAISTVCACGGSNGGNMPTTSTGARVFLYQGGGSNPIAGSNTTDFSSNGTPANFFGTVLYGIGLQGTSTSATGWLTTSGTAGADLTYIPSNISGSTTNMFFASNARSAVYNGSRTGGTIASNKSLISNPANWTTSTTGGVTVNNTAFSIPAPPTATVTGTNVSCWGGSDGSATVSVSGGMPPYSYSWAPSGGSSATATGLAAGTYVCTITDAASMTITRTRTITQPASALTVTGANTLCATTTLTASMSGGTWSSSNTAVATVGSTGIVSGVAAGTAIISYNHTCGTTKVVTVNLPNSGTISGSTTVCVGATAPLSTTGSGGTWSSSNANASVTSGGVVTGVTAGTSRITYTVTNGCGSASSTYTVSISARPTIGVVGDTTIYAGSATSLTANGGVSYTWSPGTGLSATTGATISANPSTTTSYTVTGTNSAGCSNTFIASVIVMPAPTLAGSTTCPGSVLTLTSSSQPLNIVWQQGGVGISTVTPTYASSATTVAGTGTSGSGATQLSSPIGVYVDAVGNIYVADVSNHRIQKWAPGATSGTTVAGTGTQGSGANQLRTPTGVYVDASGNIYVADNGNARIQKWAPGATSGTTVAGITGTPGSAANRLQNPYGVYVDAGGNIYVADDFNSRIQKWAPGATSGTTVAGTGTAGSGANQLRNPNSVFVDAGGNIYVTDYSNARIQKWAPGATSGTTVAGTGTGGSGANQLSGPIGVYVDAGGNIYVADQQNHRIQKWAPGATSGTTVAGTGTSGSGANQLNQPSGTYVDAVGSIYVGDKNNNRIQKFAASIVTTYTAATAGSYAAEVTTQVGTVTTNTVTVNGIPDAGIISGASSVCAGANTTLSTTGSGGTWSSSNANASVTSGGVVTGVSAGTSLISYTVSGACGSASSTYTITITPAATAPTVSGAGNVCEGATTTLSTTGTGGTWSSSSANATVSSGGVVTGVSAGTSLISYTVSGACGSVIATHAITVSPIPNPGTISGTASIFTSATTTLTASGTSGGTWSSTNTAVGTVSTSGVVTGASAGTTTISYTVTNSCGSASATIIVTVTAALGTPITGTLSVCVGSTTTLSNATSGGSWSSSNTAKAIVNATGEVTGVAAGTSVISYTLSGTAVTAVVTVNPLPDAGTISGTAIVCPGGETTFSTTSAMTGSWSSTNTTVGTVAALTGAFTGSSVGTTTISYTVTNGCGTVASTKVATVNPLPVAGTITGASSVNNGASTTLSNTTSGGTWSSSDVDVATVGSTGIVTGVSPGTVVISYTVTNLCGSATATKAVTVNAALGTPITGTLTVCVGSNTSLSNATSGGSWSSSNTARASVNATGVVTGVSAGTAEISYTLSGASVTAIVTVNTAPVVGAITGLSSVCAGGNITLNNATTGGTWSSTDTDVATVGTSGVVSGLTAGTTIISYTVSNGCGTDVTTRVITVNPLPNAGTITGASTVNAGASITLANATTGGAWSSSSPAIATVGSTGVVTGVSAGTVTISYTVTTSCGSASATKTVTVNAALSTPIAGTLTVCVGSTTTLSNATSGGNWSSGNTARATVNATGEVTGVSAGTTVISYTLLATTITAVVTVNTAPVAGTISGPSSICAGSNITVNNATTGGTWSSTDTDVATIGTSGIVSGLTAGTTTISYTVSNGCGTDVATRVITVNPLPDAGTITGASSVCRTTTATLSSTVPGGTWSSSYAAGASVNTSTGVVTGLAVGSFTISYRLTNGCGTSYAVFPITVLNAPALGAISGTATVCESATTTLANTTAGGTWSSTNTGAATIDATTGVVTGVAAGTTTISYTVTNICGSATASRVVTVNLLPVAAVITGTSTLSAGTTTTLTATPAAGTWLSGSGAIASINASGVLTGVSAGVATISYNRSTTCGVATATVAVTVSAAITPITGTRIVCPGATTNLANATTGGTWSTADGATATVGITTGVVTGVAAGTTTVTYTFSSGGNVTATVTVNAAPAAYTGSGILCSGSQLNLGSIIPGCTWTSGNTTRATVVSATGIVTGGASLGTVNISYTNAAACRTTTQLTVNAGLAATTGVSSPCSGSSITLSNASIGGTWSSSNTARAIINETSGVLTAVSGGTVTISYTVSVGCIRTTVVTVASPATIGGNPNVCLGQTSYMTSAGGAWNGSSNPAVASIAASGFVTGVSAGTAVITYRSTSNPTCFVTQTVTVNPLPSVIVPVALCPTETATLTSSPSGGTWTSAFPLKATVDPASGLVTAVILNSDYFNVVNITYTLPTTCSRTAIVTVNQVPAPIGGGVRNICIAGSTTLTSSTSGGVWSSASPSVATVTAGGIVSGASAGLANISYSNAVGCASTAQVTVNAIPGANSGTASVCRTATTTLSNAAGAGTWTSSNSSTASVGMSTGIVTGTNVGTANISYHSAPGCTSVTVVTVNSCARPSMTEGTDGDNSIFTVSPNPTTGAINLTTDVSGKVVIYTIDGKELQQYEAKAGTTAISLPSGIASGVYMLRFNGSDGSSKMVRLVYQQ